MTAQNEAVFVGSRILTRSLLNSDPPKTVITNAHFRFAIATLENIAAEFGVDRSNAKDKTIMKGCQHLADATIAQKLAGRRFLIDTKGRELPPALGHFSDEVINVVDNEIFPDSTNEVFELELVGIKREAIKFKLLLKKILMFGQIVHVNETDGNLVIFEVTNDLAGEGVVEALFQGGAQDCDVSVSMTEVTNFKLREAVNDL